MSGRLPGVEGLRAVAAAAVLVHHVPMVAREQGAEPLVMAGPLNDVFADLRWGLVLFFVLSGFLLFRPFAAAILDGRALPSIRRYTRHRALRILPAYWLILLATSFVLGTAAIWSGDGFGALSGSTLVADLLLVQNYSTDTVLTGIGPAWSLVVEIAFYVLLPVLAVGAAALAARWTGPRGRLLAALCAAAALVVCGVVGKAAYAAGIAPAGWGIVTQTLLPVHADLFGYGMAAAVLHVLLVDGRLRLPGGWRTGAFALAGGLMLLTALVGPSLAIDRSGQWSDSAVGIACALILVAVCVPAAVPTRAQRLLSLRPMVGVGLVSYSVYLWHVPLLIWLRERGLIAEGEVTVALVAVVAGAVTLALSALTWRFVEAPAQAFARRRQVTEPVPAPATEPEPALAR